MRWVGEGSHFWALASGKSSDEEGEEDGKGSPESGGDGKFFRDTLLSGFSIDELKRAEVLSVEVQSPVFGSAGCGAGHANHPRTLARRVVDAVAEQRAQKSKSWKGPSPLARSSPALSLDDIVVKDSHLHGAKGTRKSLLEFCGAQHAQVAVGSPSSGKKTAMSDLDVDFEIRNCITVQLYGPDWWADQGQLRAQRVFKCARGGLGLLFMRAGRPTGFPRP